MSEEEIAALAAQLEEDLIKRYDTHVVTGEQLRKALGYRSIDALRQAIVRKTIPVTVFSIENRRGKHALVKDIARWLAENARGNNEGGD